MSAFETCPAPATRPDAVPYNLEQFGDAAFTNEAFADDSSGETLLEDTDRELPYAVETEAETPTLTGAALRQAIVARANAELQRWGDGQKQETEAAMRPALRDYWGTVISGQEIEDAIDNRDAWSAVFVSWVMREAGAGSAFTSAAAHRLYAAAAKKARLMGDAAKFQAFRIGEATPEVGDVICVDRKPEGSTSCSGTTYENVDDGQKRATHGDVVVEVDAGSIRVVGGNVGQSVKHKVLTLDATGHVAQPATGCRFFAIIKPPGGGGRAAASGGSAIGDALAALPGVVADAVRRGVLTLEAAVRLVAGERDENTLTNLLFQARHPELPSPYRIKPGERAFAEEWTRLRDTVVRPLLRSLGGTSAPAPSSTGSTSAPGVSAAVVARIDGHRDPIERAATANGVPANLLRGIIAAESGGDARTGAGGSGYKGLMQSDRTVEDLDPAVSTTKGAKKYVDFTQSMRRYFRDVLKQDFDALPEETRIRLVMASYNAGPGTVKRAIGFARAAGDVGNWLAPEHYLRALLSTGAYNPVASVLLWCVAHGELSADDLAADLARLAGKSADEVRRAYGAAGAWNVEGLAGALAPHLFTEKRALVNDGSPTWVDAQRRASRSLLCAARFKQAHTRGYLDTVVRYKRYFDAR